MIRVLPAQIVNQIAAGEVIERPFSVVKELVENSLDAGATRITVELVSGGVQMIRITDDGAGFSAADLGLAFASHATSKLSELADLDHIASLGFRGEALASIGAVSRAWIRSRRPDADSGFEVRAEGGAIEPVRPCGCPKGSIVEIRDLFHNTPARRRFLKTPRAEKAKCQDLLVRLALTRLDVCGIRGPAATTPTRSVCRRSSRLRSVQCLTVVPVVSNHHCVFGVTLPLPVTR